MVLESLALCKADDTLYRKQGELAVMKQICKPELKETLLAELAKVKQ